MSRSLSTRNSARTRHLPTLGLGLLSLTLGACGSSQGSTQRQEGFVHPSLPYMVREAGGGPRVLAGWRVDNLEADDDGGLGDPKQGGDYTFALQLDNDGDGVREYFVDLARYDLRLKNDAVGAEVFVRTQPLSPATRALTPEMLFNNWLAAVGHTGELAPDLAAEAVKGEAPKFATKVVSRQSRAVDGQPAFEAVVEVADVPPAGVQDHTQWRRVKAVVVKTNFDWPANTNVPALLMAVQAANASQFDQSASQFASFVDNIEFLTDAQMVALRNADILNECKPEPRSFNLKMSVTKDGKRTAYSTEPGLEEDPKACLEYYLDQMQLPARGQSHSFEVKLGPSVNALQARPKPPAASPVSTGAKEGALEVGSGAKEGAAGEVGTGAKDGAAEVGSGSKNDQIGAGAKEGAAEVGTGSKVDQIGAGAKEGAAEVGTGSKIDQVGAGAKEGALKVGTGTKTPDVDTKTPEAGTKTPEAGTK